MDAHLDDTQQESLFATDFSLAEDGIDNLESCDDITLEHVKGVSSVSKNALSSNPCNGHIAFLATSVLVISDPRYPDQAFIENLSSREITAVTFSDDGQYVAYGEAGIDPVVAVYNAKQYGLVNRFKVEGKCLVKAIQFHPKSFYLVVIPVHDYCIVLYDFVQGKKLASTKWVVEPLAMTMTRVDHILVVCGHRKIVCYSTVNVESTRYEVNVMLDKRAIILGKQGNYTFVDITCGRDADARHIYTITFCGYVCEIHSGDIVINQVLKLSERLSCIKYEFGCLFVGCSNKTIKICNPSDLTVVAAVSTDELFGPDVLQPESWIPSIDITAMTINPITSIVTTIASDHKMHSWYFHLDNNSVQVSPVVPDESGSTASKHTVLTNHDLQCNIARMLMLTEGDNLMRRKFKSGEKSRLSRGRQVNSIKITPDGKNIIIGNEKGEIKHCDAQTGSVIKVIEAHSSAVTFIELMFDDVFQLVATGGRDRFIFILNFAKDFQLIQAVHDHSSAIVSISLVHNNGVLTLISSSSDGVILIRRASKAEKLNFVVVGELPELTGSKKRVYNHSSGYIITGQERGRINLFAAVPCTRLKPKRQIQIGEKLLKTVAIDPTGTFFVAYSSAGQFLFHIQTGQQIATLCALPGISYLSFSPDVKYLINSNDSGCKFLWRLPKKIVDIMQTKISKEKNNREAQASKELQIKSYMTCFQVCQKLVEADPAQKWDSSEDCCTIPNADLEDSAAEEGNVTPSPEAFADNMCVEEPAQPTPGDSQNKQAAFLKDEPQSTPVEGTTQETCSSFKTCSETESPTKGDPVPTNLNTECNENVEVLAPGGVVGIEKDNAETTNNEEELDLKSKMSDLPDAGIPEMVSAKTEFTGGLTCHKDMDGISPALCDKECAEIENPQADSLNKEEESTKINLMVCRDVDDLQQSANVSLVENVEKVAGDTSPALHVSPAGFSGSCVDPPELSPPKKTLKLNDYLPSPPRKTQLEIFSPQLHSNRSPSSPYLHASYRSNASSNDNETPKSKTNYYSPTFRSISGTSVDKFVAMFEQYSEDKSMASKVGYPGSNATSPGIHIKTKNSQESVKVANLSPSPNKVEANIEEKKAAVEEKIACQFTKDSRLETTANAASNLTTLPGDQSGGNEFPLPPVVSKDQETESISEQTGKEDVMTMSEPCAVEASDSDGWLSDCYNHFRRCIQLSNSQETYFQKDCTEEDIHEDVEHDSTIADLPNDTEPACPGLTLGFLNDMENFEFLEKRLQEQDWCLERGSKSGESDPKNSMVNNVYLKKLFLRWMLKRLRLKKKRKNRSTWIPSRSHSSEMLDSPGPVSTSLTSDLITSGDRSEAESSCALGTTDKTLSHSSVDRKQQQTDAFKQHQKMNTRISRPLKPYQYFKTKSSTTTTTNKRGLFQQSNSFASSSCRMEKASTSSYMERAATNPRSQSNFSPRFMRSLTSEMTRHDQSQETMQALGFLTSKNVIRSPSGPLPRAGGGKQFKEDHPRHAGTDSKVAVGEAHHGQMSSYDAKKRSLKALSIEASSPSSFCGELSQAKGVADRIDGVATLFRNQDEYLRKLKEVRRNFELSIQALSNERKHQQKEASKFLAE